MPVAVIVMAQIALAVALLVANLVASPGEGLQPPVPELLSLAAAVNAVLVLRRARVRGMSLGLGIALAGGLPLLALAACPFWISVFIPPVGLFNMFEYLERTLTILGSLALAGLLALLFGWGMALLMRPRPLRPA